MFKLVPDWAHNYQEYWDSIRNRNIWFIHLRYAAVAMLVAILVISIYVLKLNLSSTQVSVLQTITLIILLYNILLHRTRIHLKNTPLKFNPLHFSLLQIILDLLALSIIVHYTGSIETPLYMLFIFHMIIGGLILPQRVIISIAVVLTFTFSGLVFAQYNSIIAHHHIDEIHLVEYSQNLNYILTSLSIFIFTIFTTVGITSRIANRLYKRERQLKESLEKIDEMEMSKQTYIMGVVHEIKSPIVAAQSIIEIVKKGYLGEINQKIEDKLDRSIVRTEEALNLINNILRISKLKLLDNLSIDKIDIKSTLEKVIDQKSDSIKNKNIGFDFNDNRKSYELVEGDQILFELVFSNILGNAIKYTIDAEKIELNLFNTHDNLIIEISDGGIGIPKEEIDMIFQQFYRASNLRTKSIEGSGLGLSLVREIIERFHGKITIQSPSSIGNEKYPGTTVIITLPLKQNPS